MNSLLAKQDRSRVDREAWAEWAAWVDVEWAVEWVDDLEDDNHRAMATSR